MAAAIPWIIAGAGAAFAAKTVIDAKKQVKETQKQAAQVQQQNAAAIKQAKDSTAGASDKASDIIRAKRATATQTVFTSPLGIGGQANVARKQLLGQ